MFMPTMRGISGPSSSSGIVGTETWEAENKECLPHPLRDGGRFCGWIQQEGRQAVVEIGRVAEGTVACEKVVGSR